MQRQGSGSVWLSGIIFKPIASSKWSIIKLMDMNNKLLPLLALLIMILTTFSSCEVIGGIFKAGVYTGVIVVVLVIVLVIWIVAKLFSRNRNG
jgi:hypothetical protein